ncbi:hypothetical protein D3C79_951450 [compost metagenome]
MADTRQLSLYLSRRHHVAIGQVAKVQFHAGLQAPVQWQLIYAVGGLASVGGRGVVPGRIHVCAAVGGDLQTLRRSGLAVRQLVPAKAREHRLHFRPVLLMVLVVDFR